VKWAKISKVSKCEVYMLGGKMKTLLGEFHDLVVHRQCGRRRAQAEVESMPPYLPEQHGDMIGRLHR
jgi:hypothetical protein